LKTLFTAVRITLLLCFVLLGCSDQRKNKSAPGNWSVDSSILINSNVPVGSLRSGMTIREVIEVFGQPTRTNLAGLEFSNSGIFISPGIMSYTLFPPFSGLTREGIGMGNTRVDVVRAYGEPTAAKITAPNVELLHYDLVGIKFQLRDGRVDWMDVSAQPIK
jgi:hypothetical protein